MVGRPWKKGESGNPNGRKPNGIKTLLWKLAKAKREDGLSRIEAILEKLLSKAESGDVDAIKYVCDRLEGKPAQALEHSGEGGSPIVIKYVNGNST